MPGGVGQAHAMAKIVVWAVTVAAPESKAYWKWASDRALGKQYDQLHLISSACLKHNTEYCYPHIATAF
jgi:hypothetical protein